MLGNIGGDFPRPKTLVIGCDGEPNANMTGIGSLRPRFKYENEKEEKTIMRKQKGFSLIELLIVVAIILIIAAIAIPNLLRAKISANESSAVGSVRNIITAEASFNSSYPNYGYAITIDQLGAGVGVLSCPATGPTPTAACLLDSALAGATPSTTKSGYTFEAAADTATQILDASTGINLQTSFTASAVPTNFN